MNNWNEDKKLADDELAREAARPWYAKAWDSYQNHRERHPFALPVIAALILLAALVKAIVLLCKN